MVLIGFATATFLTFGTLLVIFGANASEIIADLELDYAAFGLLGSMFSLGLGVGIVASGPIVDRAPWRPVYVVACSVVIAAATTIGPETGYALLFVHMIALGLGAGFYETVANAMVIEAFGTGARKRLLFIHSGAALAACVSPLLIGWARASFAIEWHDTFVIAGLLHLPLIAAAFFVTTQSAKPEGATDASEFDADATPATKDRIALAAICVAAFAYVGVEAALTIFLVDYAAVDLGLDSLRAARTISAFWAGLFVGRVVSGMLPRAPGAGTVSTLSIVGAALVFVFGTVPLESPEFVMAAVGLLLSSAFPVLIGLAGTALPSSPATAVGLAGGLGSLGGFAIPWATGHLASHSGLPFALASLCGWLVLLGTAAAVARFRRAG
jgi:fucose permease